jgi:hypothetical protein
MAAVSLYFVGRYQGRWAEADSATFAELIRSFVHENRLAPANVEVYPNGFAFQAISAFIISLSGLDVGTLQQLVYPLIATLLVLPAWALYRELTGSARGATLASMLLFTQPEFLFVILRSSHEKFTRTFLLICLFLLARSFRHREQPWMFAIYVGLFYLTAFAFITSNNLLAHSFIFAVASALLLGWGLRRVSARRASDPVLRRLAYATIVCLGFAYIFTFYAYPPAQNNFFVLRNIWDRVAALLLDVQANSSNSYAQVQTGWISLPIYFLVSSANWVILAASFTLWVRQGLRWLRRRAQPTPAEWLLWLFYAAFVVQGGLSVVVDATGVLGSNLQHRIFPSFSIVAVAVVGAQLARWRPRRYAAPIGAALAAGVAVIAILSVLKASNEPALSNKWTFYQADELAALEWSDAHQHHTKIWTEYDERLIVAFRTAAGESRNGNDFTGGAVGPTTRDFILTDLTRLRSSRQELPLPVPADALRVYDNGEAEVYHLRPRTPHQR